MGRLGQTEAGDRSLTQADNEAIRHEIIIGGIVGVICALAFVGWALTTLLRDLA